MLDLSMDKVGFGVTEGILQLVSFKILYPCPLAEAANFGGPLRAQHSPMKSNPQGSGLCKACDRYTSQMFLHGEMAHLSESSKNNNQ